MNLAEQVLISLIEGLNFCSLIHFKQMTFFQKTKTKLDDDENCHSNKCFKKLMKQIDVDAERTPKS